jgi:RNA polymerase sigma factor (sigma-70 family)
MRDDPVITALVARAANGQEQAWDALVERYAPLIWSICRRHRLDGADAGDVGQRVWLQLADHLDTVRDPAALPGWLATTTRRECARVQHAARGAHAAGPAPDAGTIADQHAPTAEEQLLAAERHAALREAFARLPRGCQQLITLLLQDPPPPYATISARLNIPAGSIGPNRRRCLDRLRRDPAIAALISARSPELAPGHEGVGAACWAVPAAKRSFPAAQAVEMGGQAGADALETDSFVWKPPGFGARRCHRLRSGM